MELKAIQKQMNLKKDLNKHAQKNMELSVFFKEKMLLKKRIQMKLLINR